MALKKQIQTKFGVPAEYHKIIEVRIDWHRQTAAITVGVFISEEIRRSGGMPIERREYPWADTSDASSSFITDKPVRAAAYAYLKTLPEFTESEDVLEEVTT